LSTGKDVIFIVVDKLNKHAHFLALSQPFTVATAAQIYFEQIYKLHGLPKTIVNNRERICLSNSLKELFTLQQVNLHMTSSYHEQTEVVDRCFKTYLRCMARKKPKSGPCGYHWLNGGIISTGIQQVAQSLIR